MKILLINCPIRLDADPSCIPYGLATVTATLKNKNFEVSIYDVNALRPPESEIINYLRKNNWDIIGISGLITTYKFQKWLINELKKINPNAIVVSGGGLATSNSKLLLNKTNVDIAVIGEGEITFLELCTKIKDGKNYKHVPGIAYKENGKIILSAPRKNIKNLDEIPFPAWEMLPIDIYLKHPIWGNISGNSSNFRDDIIVKKSMNIIASRGCPYSCNYCYHLFGQSKFRYRSPENVIKEVLELINRYNVDFIGFVDDNMMTNENWITKFCDLIAKHNIKINWGCHGRVTSVKEHIIEKMAKAGCVWIGYGIESGSQKILNLMNKKVTVKQAENAIKITRKYKIFANTTFIFGYPGETLETIQETINFKRDLDLSCGSFFATPYPKTKLYNKISGLIDDEEKFIESLGNATKFTINLTDFDDHTLFSLKKSMDINVDV